MYIPDIFKKRHSRRGNHESVGLETSVNNSSENFAELLTLHMNDMYALAYQLTGSKSSAEDLVQDLFVNLSVKRYQEREILRPRAWLATILYRIFVDQWRRQQRSPVSFGIDDEHYDVHQAASLTHSFAQDPIEQLDLDKRQQLAMRILETLNERHRQIILLHDIEGYTLIEIAQIMDIPIGTVKSNLHRAKKQISALLANIPVSNNMNATGPDKQVSDNGQRSEKRTTREVNVTNLNQEIFP